MEINMTQHPSYNESEIERPRICGGILFLKLVKSGRCNQKKQKKEKKNQDPLLTSSSSHSSSSVSRGLNSSSPARFYISKSSSISDGSISDDHSLSTIPINMYDPSKTQYCMPRQIMGTRTTSSIEHKDCSKLDFKLHEELNSDIFLAKEDPDNFSSKLEGNELHVEEHVSSQSIIQIDPHLINDLKSKHLQSIGEIADCAENQIKMEQDVVENTENRSVASRLQDHSEQEFSALFEVLSELEQADDVDENKDVDATWSSLQRVRISQKTSEDGERRNIDGLEQNQESYESKDMVINSKSKPFRHNPVDIEQLLSCDLNLNSWSDEGDNTWDKSSFFSSKNQSQVDDNCAQENFKSEWNLTFHNPDDDNKLERNYKFASMRKSAENEMSTSAISGSIMHTNESVTRFPEMELAEKCNENMNETITITFSEPILPSRQLESEDGNTYVTASVDSKIQRKKNDTDAWLKSSTLSNNVSKLGSGMLENPITMKCIDSKIGGDQNCNIHQLKKKNIVCTLTQKEGTCDRTNQKISDTIIPEIMNEKRNKNVRRTDEYLKDIKLVQKLLKKYDKSYEAPSSFKNSIHRKRSSIHRENLVCSNGLENPIDDELHRKAGCTDTVIDASLDSWFHRHAALAAQVTNKKNFYGKTQQTVKLNADKISYLSQQKDHMVRISPREKSDFSGGVPTTSRLHFKNPIADLSENNNNQMVNSKGGMVDDQHTKLVNTTSRNPVQTVRKLSSETIKFWETSK
mmetsp:Transcript_899/g.994  ORF Transcript_899/g.994 Transcript_899/m.994 type:complete len:747 (+) Transcript_899:54-2294(+)